MVWTDLKLSKHIEYIVIEPYNAGLLVFWIDSKLLKHIKFIKDIEDMGMGHLWLKWVGHLWLKWVGHLQLRWVGQLWQSELLYLGRYAHKSTGLQGSTLSGHRMTTGFSPFELPTHGLLQKGRDHSFQITPLHQVILKCSHANFAAKHHLSIIFIAYYLLL